MNKLGAAVFILICGGALSFVAATLRPDTFWAGMAGFVMTAIFVGIAMFTKRRYPKGHQPIQYQPPPTYMGQDPEWLERQQQYHDIREIARNSRK